jgi:hypothetical protein
VLGLESLAGEVVEQLPRPVVARNHRDGSRAVGGTRNKPLVQ